MKVHTMITIKSKDETFFCNEGHSRNSRMQYLVCTVVDKGTGVVTFPGATPAILIYPKNEG